MCLDFLTSPTVRAWTCLGCNRGPQTKSFLYRFEDLKVDICCDKTYLFDEKHNHDDGQNKGYTDHGLGFGNSTLSLSLTTNIPQPQLKAKLTTVTSAIHTKTSTSTSYHYSSFSSGSAISSWFST